MRAVELRRLLIGMTPLMLVIGVLAGLVIHLLNQEAWVRSNLETVEQRHARLLGLHEQADQVQSAKQHATELIHQYVYSNEQDGAQTGNVAQQKLRSILTSAGLQVVSSQVLPVKDEKGFDRIPITIAAEGDMLALQSALAVFGGQQPAMFLDELEVQLQGALLTASAKQIPKLTVRLNLSVLREGQ